jgi:hypothetical protein
MHPFDFPHLLNDLDADSLALFPLLATGGFPQAIYDSIGNTYARYVAAHELRCSIRAKRANPDQEIGLLMKTHIPDALHEGFEAGHVEAIL